VFALDVGLNLMAIFVYPGNYYAQSMPPIAMMLLGYKFSTDYPKYAREKAAVSALVDTVE
jgi:hypothetical protein